MNISNHSVPNQQLNQVLHTHRLFAMNAIGGPSLWNNELAKLAASARFTENYKVVLDGLQHESKDIISHMPGKMSLDFKLPQSLPIQPSPFLLTADSKSEQCEATLEDEVIPCFEIGGEKRLCLPQIFKTVLKDYSLNTINQACDDLYIYCSRCNAEQLESFKNSGYIPKFASTCGLITMTDAERLCAILLHGSSFGKKEIAIGLKRRLPNEANIPVYHECFGGCHGFLKSALYTDHDAKCIECVDCGKLFSAYQFVSHSHSNEENRICHWGFESKKWQLYLMFANETITDEAECRRLGSAFNDIINRFSGLSTSTSRKRKSDSQSVSSSHTCAVIADDEENKPAKRSRDSFHPVSSVESRSSGEWLQNTQRTFPAGTYGWPLPPGVLFNNELARSRLRLGPLSVGIPILENPESVVKLSDISRFGKNFSPNVALHPITEDKKFIHMLDKNTEDTADYINNNVIINKEAASHNPSNGYMLSSLTKMENLFFKVLATSKATVEEKETIADKYLSHSNVLVELLLSGNHKEQEISNQRSSLCHDINSPV